MFYSLSLLIMARLNVGLLVAAFLLLVLVILQSVIIGVYADSFEEHQQILDDWHNICDSLIDRNCELSEKVIELQDSIITLKYKED